MDHQFERIVKKIKIFRNEREWAQFHDPKNLAEAISVEAGELLENFLWRNIEESSKLDEKKIDKVKEEISDIFIFTLYLCDVLKIDLFDETEKKIKINTEKYPVDKSKGTAKKYKDL